MFCSSCGNQIPTGAAFCPTCRAAIAPNTSTTAASPSAFPLQTPSSGSGSPSYEGPQQYPYQPLNPYAVPLPPPPPPPRRKARIGLIIGTVVLVVLLASVGVFALSRSPATPNLAVKTTPSFPTTTQNLPTTPATPLSGTATATNQLETIPYAPYHGTLVLNDTLKENTALTFGEGSDASGDTCQFSNGAYHASQSTGRSTALCTAPATDFSNFVYEVQMTIVKGDGGGIFFRADFNSTKLYLFFVGANGLYALVLYTDSSHVKPLKNSTLSPAINRGLNQPNLISVGANGNTITLYINHQQLVSVNDNTYSHGQIGVTAAPYVGSTNPTEVVFNNAKVWTV